MTAIGNLPEAVAKIVGGAPLTETSGRSAAHTYRIERSPAAFVKIAPAGSLARAALLGRYWAAKGLTAPILAYVSADRDYLVSEAVPGRDGISPELTREPERLARTCGEAFRYLHGQDFSGCPVDWLSEAQALIDGMRFDKRVFEGMKPLTGVTTEAEAKGALLAGRSLLRRDALVHGDACLPNILLNDWRLSGFIDIAEGGAGDRHFDIAWALWSIRYNLKEDRFLDAFLDAYGRDAIDADRLRVAALVACLD